MTSFPPIEYRGRIATVRQRYLEYQLDALLVTNPTNIRWLTGFTGSSAKLVIHQDGAVLVTDGRYRDRATDELTAADAIGDVEIAIGFTLSEQRKKLVALLHNHSAVGAESDDLSHATFTDLAADIALVSSDDLVAQGRRRKDAGELARITAAARAADAALAEVAPQLNGMTEHEVRTELDYRMRRHGADGPGYDTIVASGPTNAARPHHDPERRRIVEGDTVIIDVGGVVDGYRSDMTRSYVIGEANDRQRELYALLLEAQLAGLVAVRAGVASRDIDRACRQPLDDAGYKDWFIHGTGHGVGLDIHENPFHSASATLKLVAGDVVTIEPGLYHVGFGGLRIEDLVFVTDEGCRVLTKTPKETPCPPSQPTI